MTNTTCPTLTPTDTPSVTLTPSETATATATATNTVPATATTTPSNTPPSGPGVADAGQSTVTYDKSTVIANGSGCGERICVTIRDLSARFR
ncbi:MAG: hypothetical protein U0528_05720 [Anaerolineae bacterium]